MRQTSQCVGRVLRSKYDYGLMIFADKRYKRRDYQDKLPQWIRDQLLPGHSDMPTDITVQTAYTFYKEMGQPFTMPTQLMYTDERICQMQKEAEALERERENQTMLGH
jgi:DNA excision repair protein ERCC-2